MKAHVDLKLFPGDRAVLRALTAEERDAVVDELLVRVREDLEWVIARAMVPEDAPAPIALQRIATRGISRRSR
jgi:hypothetical protein